MGIVVIQNWTVQWNRFYFLLTAIQLNCLLYTMLSSIYA